ncbi:MAG: ATP-binding protein [Anaerolineales bacterium]|nr:ATP-binding protein [Anaerolineales bacterium]
MFSLTLTVPARLDAIEAICEAVDSAGKAAGFDERTRYACQLAASEACENIVKHGYGDQALGEIEARLQASPNDLTVELIDTASPFNPAEPADAEPWSVDNPPVGGLGLLIIQRVMDEVRYERSRGQNRLVMRKHAG